MDENFLLHLVDVVHGEIHEDVSVPSTKWAKEMIDKAKLTYPVPIKGSREDRGCPCLYLDEPCHPRCTCKDGFSSFGCMFCATYGGIEQRKEKAKVLAAKLRSQPL